MTKPSPRKAPLVIALLFDVWRGFYPFLITRGHWNFCVYFSPEFLCLLLMTFKRLSLLICSSCWIVLMTLLVAKIAHVHSSFPSIREFSVNFGVCYNAKVFFFNCSTIDGEDLFIYGYGWLVDCRDTSTAHRNVRTAHTQTAQWTRPFRNVQCAVSL